MHDGSLLEVLHQTADAVAAALEGLSDWGPAGREESTHEGQYHSDLVADSAAMAVLGQAGLDVLSEESGRHGHDSEVLVVLDPLDGSTNASRGLPWYATSLCALDGDGPRAAVVANQASGVRYEALRGGGARRDGAPIRSSGVTDPGSSIVALSGWLGRHLGWQQYRVLGAAALDLCSVAEGVVDAFIGCAGHGLGPWDYLGGLLVCREAGAALADMDSEELLVLAHADRRRPVAAATPQLLEELLASLNERQEAGAPPWEIS